MPRNGSGVYSLPAGSIVTDGVDDILASQHNGPLQDLESDMNEVRPIVAGGTGASTASAARTALGLDTMATQAASAVAITGGTITGVTALRGPNGSAATPGLTFSSQTDMGLYNSTSNVMGMATAGVMRATVSSVALTMAVPVHAQAGTTTAPSIAGSGDTDTGISFLESDRLLFLTGGVERARFNNGGSLLIAQSTLTNPGVGSTTTGHALTPEGRLHASAADTYAAGFNVNTDGNIVRFGNSGSAAGTISVSGLTTAYNTSSDYRLKDALPWQGEYDPIATVKELSALLRFYAWKADGKQELGWFAHELQAVTPEAVTGEKDGADMQGRDDAKLVKHLVAAVADLIYRVEALENA